ncbi:Prenylcysteine oxidase [Varanus komodoensis]|nr:Prenylcysteine oxidase [Varanus komodoensis]
MAAAARRLLLPLLLLLASLGRAAAPGAQELRHPPARIGVIGAGIGGTSAAYFLRQKFGKDIHIDIFEREKVGGRLTSINLEGRYYEGGGSIIHPLNLHMKHFVKELGGLMGIYNGEEFVFEESSWYIWNFFKLIWNYGLNAIRMHMWVEDIMDKFMRIYRYQSHDYAFSSNEVLLHALGGTGFVRMLNQTIDESMQNAGFSQKFINEMVTPVMRVNYGQSTSINGFVGAVSLAGADSGLWAVAGGNQLVCSGLLQASKAQLIPGTVTSLEEKTRQKARTGETLKQYEITYSSTAGITSELYDIVLIATPLHRKIANLTFRNFNPPIPDFSSPYEHIVTTLVHGQINSSFFGYQDPSQFSLSAIFTTDNPKLFINSIGIVSPVQDKMNQITGPPVWKIFSAQPLTKQQINMLFSSYDSIAAKKWLAYPHYSPPEKIPPVVLRDQLYYLSSIEWVASAMEMNAISAKNVALLAYHRWYKEEEMIDQEDLHERLKTEL